MNQTWERTCSFRSVKLTKSLACAPLQSYCLGGVKAVTVQGAQGVSTQSGEGTRTTRAKDDTWLLKGPAGVGQEEVTMG